MIPITSHDFAVAIGLSLLMGLVIGFERQLGRHPAGLRTNALVCAGAAMFVSVSRLVVSTDSPLRIAAQVVSGIGFLGGGVILREGLTVKGMTTAATLWCSAAIGVLAGSGMTVAAWIGTGFILATNIILHPLSEWIDRHVRRNKNVDTEYKIKVICAAADESRIRSLLAVQINTHHEMIIQGISTHATDDPTKSLVVAEIQSTTSDERVLHDLVTMLNNESSTSSVSWERAP